MLMKPRFLFSALEIVPNSPFSHQMVRLCGICLKLVAQAVNVYVDSADIALIISAPDYVQKIFT